MSIDFTGIGAGIELDNAAVIIPLTGAPGGGVSDTVGIGSIGLSDNGKAYGKKIAGAGANKWELLGGIDQISWREPVLVKDNTVYANLAAAELVINTNPFEIDGVVVGDTDAILFTAIAGESKNVFIVNGTPGAGATLVESVNAASINDVVKIDDGTDTEKAFYFDGASWIDPDAAVLVELANIRAFVGKPTAGAVLPLYTDERVVSDSDSLNTAVDKLDGVSNVHNQFLGVVGGVTQIADSVLVDDLRSVTWEVTVVDTTNGNVSVDIIMGGHDGLGGADASVVNAINPSKYKIGTPVAGLIHDVVLVGVGAAQVMNLTVVSTNATDVTVMRHSYTKAS
jgi:hypothetical protein